MLLLWCLYFIKIPYRQCLLKRHCYDFSRRLQLDKDRAHALSWVIEDAVIDLIASAKFYQECQSKELDPFSNKYHLGLIRMCHTTSIITLCKIDEAINGFGKELNECPEELVKRVREVKTKIESLGVYKFRSTYVAHVFDGKGKNKMPIEINKGYDLFTTIVGKNEQEVSQYYEWLFSPYKTDNDVVSILVFLNDYLSNHVSRSTRY